MYQQLREDPRRRFALAYTIEDAEMRLWFCNRSEMLVSTTFNFITVSHVLRLIVSPLSTSDTSLQGHDNFVRFVLGIAFAEDHQIGWDTTMKLLPTPLSLHS